MLNAMNQAQSDELSNAAVSRRLALTAAHGAILFFLVQTVLDSAKSRQISHEIMSALGFSVAGVFLGACAGYSALIFKRRLGVIFEALSAGVLLFVVLTAIYAFMNFVPAPHA